jgi:pimeloyl-ACP methyl ester carboxylesterase
MKHRHLIIAIISTALLLPKFGFADSELLKPCPVSTHSKILDYEDKALCARVALPEANQDNARSISLNVVVLPATTRAKQADPIVLLAGGPGQSVVSVGPSWAGRFENLRKHRDFLLIDQRGTGDSNSLACAEALAPIFDESDLNNDVNLVLDQQITALKDCLTTLDADPRFYTTIDAAADLEAVRQRLGYPAMNLFGISYGTRIALVFNRLYPDAVRSLLLDAVAPVDMLIPARVGLDADLAFTRITAECYEAPSCQKAFPDLPAQLLQAEQRLRQTPNQLITNPLTGEQQNVTLDPRVINRLLRSALYSRTLRQVIPLAISEASKGRWQVLAGIAQVLSPDASANDLSLGMMASVLCSEDMSRMTPQPQNGVYFDNALQELLAGICPVWPHIPVAEDYFLPVASQIPALLMSGTEDPITPPVYAERALAFLPNGHHLEVVGGAHGVSQLGCLPTLIEGFLKDLSFSSDEAQCVQTIQGQPFFTNYAGPFETEVEATADD